MTGRKYLALLLLTLIVACLFHLVPSPPPPLTVHASAAYTPITVVEESGNDLTNYAVKIVLDSTNFPHWDYVSSENGDDVYFLDAQDKPLYYWIEYFNKTEQQAIMWVKVPSIPANGNATIYMYYGAYNPYESYNNASMVFLFFDDFSTGDLSKWSITNPGNSVVLDNNNYVLKIDASQTNNIAAYVPHANAILEFKYKIVQLGPYGPRLEAGIRAAGIRDNAYIICNEVGGGHNSHWIGVCSGGTCSALIEDGTAYQTGIWYTNNYILAYGSKIEGKIADSSVITASDTSVSSGNYIYFMSWDSGNIAYIDDVRLRPYVEPEPSFSIGKQVVLSVVSLPSDTLFLQHSISYSPNSTQFSHSFTAANTTTAGYETNYTDAWGWRVYADPYLSAGVSTENNASLVSQVNVTLPYSSIYVGNLTFYARTNATGSYRQLWVRVLNSTGGVVAELTNATMDTSWTSVTLIINATLSDQVTIWVNATIKTTTTTGEEIGVKDFVLNVEYGDNPTVYAELRANKDYFNCSVQFTVDLGNASLVNLTAVVFKFVEYLSYNTTDYPVEPVYVGNETINGLLYNVYKIDPANHTGTYMLYALIENKIKTFRTHAKGYDTDTFLVGETLTIELPLKGNVTIPDLNLTYINTTGVKIIFNSTGTYTINVNRTLAEAWSLGQASKAINVIYGSLDTSLFDVDGRQVDYEDLALDLIDKATGTTVASTSGNKVLSLDNLWAGNYTIELYFKGTLVWRGEVELNASNLSPSIDASLVAKALVDYRGLNRSIVLSYGRQLLGVEDLSKKFPYSRMKMLLNGTGAFKLYINYRGDLPTKIFITSNITGLKYYWNGSYLVFEGILGSVGELNITDLYKFRLEIRDRLGNLMPSWIYAFVNNSKYSGAVAEDYYYPDDYLIELPKTINGFEFYSFFDGFNQSSRVITINNTDVAYKVWYRVPTSIEVKSIQVSSSEAIKAYVEGYLKDYYGNGVPNRQLILNITNVETGYTESYNITTDVAGYFRSPIFELFRGKTYKVEIFYNGDDIYVGTLSSTEVKPEELPAAPAVLKIPVNYLLIIIGVALIAFGIFAAVRATRHVIEEVREKSRKFVKKKNK